MTPVLSIVWLLGSEVESEMRRRRSANVESTARHSCRT